MEEKKVTKIPEEKQNKIQQSWDLEDEYQRYCNARGVVIAFQNGFKEFKAVRTPTGNYILNDNVLNEKQFKITLHITDKKFRDDMVSYVLNNKVFYSYPQVYFDNYIYESSGEMRADLKNDINNAFVPHIRVNWATSSIHIRSPYRAPDKNNNKDIDTLLSLIVGEDNAVVLKRYLAQIVCENRTGSASARPTLVMFGERGSGKGLILDLIRALMPGQFRDIPQENYNKYNSFLTSRIIVADETNMELQHSSMSSSTALYDFSKRVSGAFSIEMGDKRVKTSPQLLNNYLIILSNDKPIHITEYPLDENNNQFLAIHFASAIPASLVAKLLNKHNVKQLKEMFEQGAGHYILHLHKIFRDILGKRSFKHYRYGFPIPLTRDLDMLMAMSGADRDEVYYNALIKLKNAKASDLAGSFGFSKLMRDFLYHFQQQHHIVHELLIFILKKQTSFGAFEKYLKRFDLDGMKLGKQVAKYDEDGKPTGSYNYRRFFGIEINYSLLEKMELESQEKIRIKEEKYKQLFDLT